MISEERWRLNGDLQYQDRGSVVIVYTRIGVT